MKSCYMCDSDGTTVEHVPPKCIFPEQKDTGGIDFRKNLITVRSCEEHNLAKAKDDQYLMLCLAYSYEGNKHKDIHRNTKIRRTLNNSAKLYEQFLTTLAPCSIKTNLGEQIESVAFEVDLDRLDNVLSQVARALFFIETNQKWISEVGIFFNTFGIPMSEDEKANQMETQQLFNDAEIMFSDVEPLGENAEIFNYKMIKADTKAYFIQMVFYENFKVIAFLNSVSE